ncbi:MAG: DNA polymerase III subunit delta' [Acidiferrobacterales bacterium]
MSTGARLYPWTLPQAQRITQDIGRLPHALLLSGPRGLGKTACAAHLAQVLSCEQPDYAAQSSCGNCQNCRLLAAGTHPDVQWVEPAEEGKVITIDQIRALAQFLYLRPHIGRLKIVIISPAEAMNTNAANSLLKLLEEPPPDSLLFLASSDPVRLPATVRSRCQRLAFSTPARREALAWLGAIEGFPGDQAELLLELAGGVPLRALALHQDGFLGVRSKLLEDMEALVAGKQEPVSCAGRWKAHGARRSLEWLEGGIMDLIRIGMAPGHETLANRDSGERLHVLKKQLNLKQLFRFLDAVSESRRLLDGPADQLLLLEDVLIRWSRLARQK